MNECQPEDQHARTGTTYAAHGKDTRYVVLHCTRRYDSPIEEAAAVQAWNATYEEVDNVEEDEEVIEKERIDHPLEFGEYPLCVDLMEATTNESIIRKEVNVMIAVEPRCIATETTKEKIMEGKNWFLPSTNYSGIKGIRLRKSRIERTLEQQLQLQEPILQQSGGTNE